jgi:putative SOS response-associated peptidase YedK
MKVRTGMSRPPGGPVVIFEKGQRVLERMVWGLIPSWAKDAKMGFSTFNARADSIDTKPAFRGAWKAGRRCLVVTDGFYEWRKADKQPFAVAMKNIKLMVMAGLWEEWKNPEDGETAPDHDAMHRALPSR